MRHTNIPACYLIIKKDNKVLLLKRANTGYHDGDYTFVSGHVDPGETFTQAMVREAKEEAGIDIKPEDLKVSHIIHRKSTDAERVDTFFTVEKWSGEIKNTEPHKCDDLSWFDINNLPKNIIPYIPVAMNNIQNNIFYSEYGWK